MLAQFYACGSRSFGVVHFCSRKFIARHEVPNGTLGDGVSHSFQKSSPEDFFFLRSYPGSYFSPISCGFLAVHTSPSSEP
jgi:hypothetical protein